MRRSLAAAVTTTALALAVGPAATAEAAAPSLPLGPASEVLGAATKAVTENGSPVGLPTDGLTSGALPTLG